VAAPCEICERIAHFNAENPYFVAELETGYAVLGDNQLYRGYTIFIARQCVPELHALGDVRATFLDEMAAVAEAVFRAFAPRKLNYELLGNSVPHVHWHLFPRYGDDPLPSWPIWNNPAFLSGRVRLEHEELGGLRTRLQEALATVRR
jgi:diadenosine tetraphosphate (Ap4A) HIT family hydrolase